jgi:hypothetical protein
VPLPPHLVTTFYDFFSLFFFCQASELLAAFFTSTQTQLHHPPFGDHNKQPSTPQQQPHGIIMTCYTPLTTATINLIYFLHLRYATTLLCQQSFEIPNQLFTTLLFIETGWSNSQRAHQTIDHFPLASSADRNGFFYNHHYTHPNGIDTPLTTQLTLLYHDERHFLLFIGGIEFSLLTDDHDTPNCISDCCFGFWFWHAFFVFPFWGTVEGGC